MSGAMPSSRAPLSISLGEAEYLRCKHKPRTQAVPGSHPGCASYQLQLWVVRGSSLRLDLITCRMHL